MITAKGCCKWAACFLLFASAVRLGAAEIAFPNLDAAQGINFNETVHTNVGYITALILNNTALSADIIVKNPLNPSSTMHVVGVLDSVDWFGGAGDALKFRARISTENKATVAGILHGILTTTAMQLNFQIYNYSTNYFESFSPLNNDTISVLLQTESSQPEISVATTANSDILSPQNWELGFTNVPSGTGQDCLIYTTTNGTRLAKNFGSGTVIPVPPAVGSAGAAQITSTGATLQETVNPGNGATAVYFNYGTNSSLMAPSCTITNTLGAGTSDVAVSIPVSNLLAQTTYYYQAIAGNSAGTNTDSINSFVTATPTPPAIGSVGLGGTGLTFSGTSGSPGTTYYVISSTNITVPPTNWGAVLTNQFDSQGNFNLTLTNAVDPNQPQHYYLIEIPAN